MSKHTPGPWKVRHLEKECWIEGEGTLLARSEKTLLKCEANAALMAVAPEMPDALKACASLLAAEGYPKTLENSTLKQALDVIRKAEGL